MTHRLPIATVLALAMSGCFSIGSDEVTVLEPPPLPYDASDHTITLTEGTAIVARIAVLDADDYLIPPDDVDWTVDGTAAMLVPTDTAGVYAVSGVQVGSATLVATSSDHTSEARITVNVTPQ